MKESEVAILPSLAMGHLIPEVELAKALVDHYDISVTFIIPTNSCSSDIHRSLFSSIPPRINACFLPPVDVQDLSDENKSAEQVMFATVDRSFPSIRKELQLLISNGGKLLAAIVDIFSFSCIEIARDLNIPQYLFVTSSATAFTSIAYLPTLNGDLNDCDQLVEFPGCFPIHRRDLPDPIQDCKSEVYCWLTKIAKRLPMAEGILVNSFLEFESRAFDALKAELPSIYPVGPIVSTSQGTNEENGSKCMKWLDDQAHGCVLYVSFGSGGVLSHQQMTELAWGLEMSQHKFIWVVRNPAEKGRNSSFFKIRSEANPVQCLPDGFLQRVGEKCVVVDSWAPQAQILRHPSTGGFLTHCGWNSTLEAVVNGVPLIAWPLYAEQRLNASMLSDHVGVAVKLGKSLETRLIKRNEICEAVKCLMEGGTDNPIRRRMGDLRSTAIHALKPAGSSSLALDALVSKWINSKQPCTRQMPWNA